MKQVTFMKLKYDQTIPKQIILKIELNCGKWWRDSEKRSVSGRK